MGIFFSKTDIKILWISNQLIKFKYALCKYPPDDTHDISFHNKAKNESILDAILKIHLVLARKFVV